MTAEMEERLMARVVQEIDRLGAGSITVTLRAGQTVGVIANLQLALKHPNNNGDSVILVRGFIEALISRLDEAHYFAHVELARLGDVTQ